jgi:uncharacterized membrane protein YkvI
MVDDMRVQRRRARRWALAICWIFAAVPSFFGFLLLVRTGYTSLLGWVIAVFFVLTTIFLAYAFVNADTLPVSQRNTGRRRWMNVD